MTDKRVARGVWKTASGWRVYVRVDGVLKPKRLPATMTLGEVKRWLEGYRVDLRREPPRDDHADAVPGTFEADAERYLKAVKAMPTWPERRRHIRLWVEALGADRLRTTIRASEIRAVRDRWLTEGPRLVRRPKTKDKPSRYEEVAEPLSASQVNNRLRALENLWTVLDGRHARNPVREVPEADEGDREPRALPWAVVQGILDAMPDRGRDGRRALGSQTRARLQVMAWTGLAHAQLATLTRDDVDLVSGTLFLRRRRKGRTVAKRGRTIPLLPDAVRAFKLFDELECWGPFSRASMWKSFQRAAQKLKLTGLRPYDFRHTFATRVVLATQDEALAAELLGHASATTIKQYTAASVAPRIAAGFERFKQEVTGGGNARAASRANASDSGK